MLVDEGQDLVVVGGVGDDGHVGVVLGRGPHERGSADVDLLDQRGVIEVALRRGLLEAIQVHHHQAEGIDTQFRELLAVRGVSEVRQHPAVDARMERLDTAVEHLRRTGDLGHVGDRQSGLAQGPCGATGGDQLEAAIDEAARELREAGLVGDGEQRPGARVVAHGSSRSSRAMISPTWVSQARSSKQWAIWSGSNTAVTSGSASTSVRKSVRSSKARRALRWTIG